LRQASTATVVPHDPAPMTATRMGMGSPYSPTGTETWGGG
jgi:hypothetical protein